MANLEDSLTETDKQLDTAMKLVEDTAQYLERIAQLQCDLKTQIGLTQQGREVIGRLSVDEYLKDRPTYDKTLQDSTTQLISEMKALGQQLCSHPANPYQEPE